MGLQKGTVQGVTTPRDSSADYLDRPQVLQNSGMEYVVLLPRVEKAPEFGMTAGDVVGSDDHVASQSNKCKRVAPVVDRPTLLTSRSQRHPDHPGSNSTLKGQKVAECSDHAQVLQDSGMGYWVVPPRMEDIPVPSMATGNLSDSSYAGKDNDKSDNYKRLSPVMDTPTLLASNSQQHLHWNHRNLHWQAKEPSLATETFKD